VSVKTFFGETASSRVASAIRDVEQGTCAEVVVAVRPSSGHYRHVDYLVGALLAFTSLLVFLFHPEPFRVDVFPAEALVLFALGAFGSAWLPPVRRLLASQRLLADNVRTAARAAFVELGVGTTAARTGLLVYVSTLERRVEVVPDIGVARVAKGSAWDGALARLADSVERDPDLGRFVEALKAMGLVLEGVLPAREGDVNELPDEVRA
jgi:putative membrane protein